jgi:hypothetical protein
MRAGRSGRPGLLITLVTVAWSPPSWPTRLPQKFSAATTTILVDEPGPAPLEVSAAGAAVEQPATVTTAAVRIAGTHRPAY